jgi:hypothetical protein
LIENLVFRSKFEIRSTKFETNSNDQNFKFETKIQNNKEALRFTFFEIGRRPYRLGHLVLKNESLQLYFGFKNDEAVKSPNSVTPANAGVQKLLK